MPRPRTSDKPPLERAKLNSVEEVNHEIRKLYRRFSNKTLNASELKSRVTALQALRAGMGDPEPPAKDFVHPGFNIVPVMAGTFMTPQACAELKETGRLPEGALIELIEPPGEPANVVPLRQLARPHEPAPERSPTKADLKAMEEVLQDLADSMGIPRDLD